MARRAVAFPPDSWPPRMQADLAAAYCGEKHVEDFLERVVSGYYPTPRHVDSARRRFWYRDDLDRAIGIAEPQPIGMGARFRAGREKRHG